ncbi:MAG TPA: hypothetical protein VEL09_09295 [Burkholderiales bacterium]|nr:hypothetical protein [Burkholderiales bacterium]
MAVIHSFLSVGGESKGRRIMNALHEWIRAAEAARVTCLNAPEFDGLIRHQKQRLEGVGSNQVDVPTNETIISKRPVEKIKGRSRGKRYVYIHNDLASAAFHFKSVIESRLEKDDRKGITFDCMACLVMSAFSFEAYINFLGSKLIEKWNERQRFDTKVEQVLDRLKVKPDWDKRPYSTIDRLKKFRDLVAHGKPDEEEYDKIVEIAADGSDSRPDLRGKWEAICATDSVFEIYEDTDLIWKDLLGKSGLSVYDTLTRGEGGVTLLEVTEG